MVLCEAGRPFARSYEVLCRKLLENVFSEDLALWSEQQKSNNDLDGQITVMFLFRSQDPQILRQPCGFLHSKSDGRKFLFF